MSQEPVLRASRKLASAVDALRFAPPVTHVYNPLRYARVPHELYLTRYATGPKKVLFLGMNPGPFGMVQTGVPFGEVNAVRDWLGIQVAIQGPEHQHPRRPIQGFDCPRCEISGQRLWGLFAQRYGKPELFFAEHAVINYCPLAFLEDTGRNRTPDKLPVVEREALYAACDMYLRELVTYLQPKWIIGVGDFAANRAREILGADSGIEIGKILHPSPASPRANRDWAGEATRQLIAQGVW